MKRPPLKRVSFRRLTLLSWLLLLIVALVIAAVLGRGWVRHSAAAWYGTQITGSSVDKAYDDSFSAFNQQLKTDGVVFNGVLKVDMPCSAASYHGVQVTIQCKKTRTMYANPDVPDKAIADWPNLYRTLTAHMAGGQSRVTSESNVSPAALYIYVSHPKGVPENNLQLDGQQGKVSCSLDMLVDAPHTYLMPYQAKPHVVTPQLLMTENCTRTIQLLGGWDCFSRQHNYCSVQDP
jgi:hypothetical protein